MPPMNVPQMPRMWTCIGSSGLGGRKQGDQQHPPGEGLQDHHYHARRARPFERRLHDLAVGGDQPDQQRQSRGHDRHLPQRILPEAQHQPVGGDQQRRQHHLESEHRGRGLQDPLGAAEELEQRDVPREREHRVDQHLRGFWPAQYRRHQAAHHEVHAQVAAHREREQQRRGRQVLRPPAQQRDLRKELDELLHVFRCRRVPRIMRRIVQVILRIRLQRIVTKAPDLAALAARLAAEPRVGLDTEFLRERTYRAQLCLVQLSSPGDATCVDPLALTDLTPLAGVLAFSAVIKVMHASRQDLEVLMPSTGVVRPVFDTQIAAALTGLPAQIGFAEAERGRLGRLEWLAEELSTLEDAGALGTEPDDAWRRLKGLNELDPARLRLTRALAAWRERRAVDSNRPRGWILDDAVLREIILRLPRSLEALAQIPGMPPAVVKHSGEELLAQLRGADIPDPPPPPPGRPRPDPAKAALVKKLAAIIQAAARELNLVPEVLATRRDLELLADGSRDVGLLRGWRRGAVGERLLA